MSTLSLLDELIREGVLSKVSLNDNPNVIYNILTFDYSQRTGNLDLTVIYGKTNKTLNIDKVLVDNLVVGKRKNTVELTLKVSENSNEIIEYVFM